MPQGGIDDGEKPPPRRRCASCEEETGVTAELVEQLAEAAGTGSPTTCPPNSWARSGRAGTAARASAGSCTASSARTPRSTSPPKHPEFSEWRWIGADEMLAAIVPFKRALYAEVIAAFRSHLA